MGILKVFSSQDEPDPLIVQSSAPERLQLQPDGSHVHALRSSRRKEKIGRIFRDFLKTKKAIEEEDEDLDGSAHDAVEAAHTRNGLKPPTLLSTLMCELYDADSEAGVNQVLESLLRINSKPPNFDFTDRYGTLSNVVGEGAFGVVRVSQKNCGGPKRMLYAVKEFRPNLNEKKQDYVRRISSEFCLGSTLHHPNIIESLDLLCDNAGHYSGVMEYCAGGDLYTLIAVTGGLETVEADCFYGQILRGLRCMHDHGIAHRDIKPENIVLTVSGTVKLTDFGNAECFQLAHESATHLSEGVCGSSPYIAPETYRGQYDPRLTDVWSAGIIYMAMRTGRHMWTKAKTEDYFYAKYLKERDTPEGYPQIAKLEKDRQATIYKVLDPEPEGRPQVSEVLEAEWIRSASKCHAGDRTPCRHEP